MSDIKALASEFFSKHPDDIEVVFITSDKYLFTEMEKAQGHASRLRNQTIVEIYHPRFTKGEIATKKADQKAQQIAGAQASFAKAFPELAASVKYNASLKRKKTR